MARGPEIAEFAEKLRLALVRANLSRAQLAQAVGVDKSVVARWLNGALHPSDHTLTLLTTALGKSITGFERADWDAASTEVAARLGLSAAVAPVAPHSAPLPDPHDPVAVGRAEMRDRFEVAAGTYSGLWLFVLPSQHDRGEFPSVACFAARIRSASDRPALLIEGGTTDRVHARGAVIVLQDHVHLVMTVDRQHSVALLSGILNGVSLGRAVVLDGMVLTTELVGEMSQHAYRVIGFRISNATDDVAFGAVLRRTGVLTQGELDGAAPADSITAALMAPVLATRCPTRVRLPRAQNWSCSDALLGRQAYAEQREALEAVRALFADALRVAAADGSVPADPPQS
jgi:transcriptional regulator with XRE-family HTH domain